jgi:hypothetical protein
MIYNVLCQQTVSQLVEEVNEYILLGWQPIGGISVSNFEMRDRDGDLIIGSEYVQALVKESNDQCPTCNDCPHMVRKSSEAQEFFGPPNAQGQRT